MVIYYFCTKSQTTFYDVKDSHRRHKNEEN